jgi:mRNA interferase RelE/StbE
VRAAIEALRDEPRPSGTKKMRARAQWRIRVGNYRVMYSIFDGDQIVIVELILPRTTHTYD